MDAEPSRFIEEIDERYLEYLTPKDSYRYRPLINIDAFAPVDKSKLRQQKPTNSPPPAYKKPNEEQLKKLRLQKPEQAKPVATGDIPNVAVGNTLLHERFGKGVVIDVEGSGADRKAKVRFENGGEKTLILRFAKFKIIG